MDIYFLRHASAGEPRMNPAKDDERKLDKEGIEQCHVVGRALAALNVTFDAIISSPLPRASETAKIVAEEIGHKSKVLTDAALKPGAIYHDFQELLQRHSGKDAIMVVGHNPSMTEFLNKLLMGDSASDAVELKKATIAKVEKEGRKPAILKWCMPPKVVRAIQQVSAKSSRPKTVSK
ncbi:MAG TPA: phosphohistidine phosphatase SixA [Terriglobales bacterium]|nr:phosphohistidine phosphatase SixA [Terriglobales bacterium]